MKKLQNDILQRFLDHFIDVLKTENDNRKYCEHRELDIPFIISTLYQSFNNATNKYDEFICDLEKWSDYDITIDETDTGHEIIDVVVNLIKYHMEDADGYYDNYDMPNYTYIFRFSHDERFWGYCQCTPDMEDYREDKHCCGHGCDAAFCKFSLHKILRVVSDVWHGDEHDYWDFEDEFYLNNKELGKKKEDEDRKRKIKELKDRIEADSKELAELESQMCK